MWESDWRFNVWQAGQNLTGFRLIARLNPRPFFQWVALVIDENGDRRGYLSLEGTLSYANVWLGGALYNSTPFPFGYGVDPD